MKNPRFQLKIWDLNLAILLNYSLDPKIWKAQYNKDAKAPKAATT